MGKFIFVKFISRFIFTGRISEVGSVQFMFGLNRVLETSGEPGKSIEVTNFCFSDGERCIEGFCDYLVEVGIGQLSIGARGDGRPVSGFQLVREMVFVCLALRSTYPEGIT